MEIGVKKLLIEKYHQFAKLDFIADDPISIPHRFKKLQDIEIAGFFASLLAWGNRKSIINSCSKLLSLLENDPYAFIMKTDFENNKQFFEKCTGFVHRTFNAADLLFLLQYLRHHYYALKQPSLQSAFTKHLSPGDANIENCLSGFYNYLFSYSNFAKDEKHCRKHIATPEKKSACKRLCMYLRWMARPADEAVDFGIWKNISPSQLVCPLDVHVSRVARKLNLINRKQDDWLTATELTESLKTIDPYDPVKYDFALFGLGAIENY